MVSDTDPISAAQGKPPIERVRRWYRGLPDKKRYFEFITAFLSIPVLLTVLISNVSNIRNDNEKPATTPTAVPVTVTVVPATPTVGSPVNGTATPSPTAGQTPVPSCTPGIGEITLNYPTEGSTVTGNPVCLEITRKSAGFCAVVWSYRVDGGSWSEYTDRDICIYGLPPGKKDLDVRVKSIVNGEQILLERTFTVDGPTPTPQATQSGTLRAS